VQSGHAILDEYQEQAHQYPDGLWRNDGDGKFTDVTREAGLGATGWSHGAVFVDYDGDDDLDIYVSRHGRNLLYQNRGDGTFSEVGTRAGVDNPGFGGGVSFADFDGDGDLDLYVANYAIYDLEEQKGSVQWFTDGVKQFPQYFEQQDNALYRNNGDGTFTDITDEANAKGHGRGLGVLATDIDDDEDIDLFVLNDVGVNNMLVNDGTGKFTEEGLIIGVDRNADGAFEASMGVAGGDWDNDGDIDLIVTNYGGEQNTLYRNEGDGLFLDVTREIGLVNQTVLDCVAWGVGFQDFNNDGRFDLLVVNGHVVPDYIGWYMGQINDSTGDISQMRSNAYRGNAEQTKLLFLGQEDGTFRDVTEEAGPGIQSPRMSRGAAFADFDGDGRVDVAVTNKNSNAQVLMNRMLTTIAPADGEEVEADTVADATPSGGSDAPGPAAPKDRSWVRIALRAPAPNTRAVGARVRLHSGDLTLTREVYAGASYISSHEYVLHFGLGKREVIDAVEVRWPGGKTEVFRNVEPRGLRVLRPGQGETK